MVENGERAIFQHVLADANMHFSQLEIRNACAILHMRY